MSRAAPYEYHCTVYESSSVTLLTGVPSPSLLMALIKPTPRAYHSVKWRWNSVVLCLGSTTVLIVMVSHQIILVVYIHQILLVFVLKIVCMLMM